MSTPLSSHAKTAEEIAEAYRSPPWWYDLRGFFILTFSYRSSLTRAIRFFGNNMGDTHLELACGTGTLLMLSHYWRRWRGMNRVKVIGVDYAESMLAGAIRRFKKHPSFTFIHGDAGNLQFDEATFDTVNIANSVHCFPEVEKALREAYRVLKPGGTFAANVLLYPKGGKISRSIAQRINEWGMRKGILVTPFERETVNALLIAAKFEVVSEVESGNCYFVIAKKAL